MSTCLPAYSHAMMGLIQDAQRLTRSSSPQCACSAVGTFRHPRPPPGSPHSQQSLAFRALEPSIPVLCPPFPTFYALHTAASIRPQAFCASEPTAFPGLVAVSLRVDETAARRLTSPDISLSPSFIPCPLLKSPPVARDGLPPPKGGKKIALRGGGGDTEAHFPNPPPPSLAAVTGGGGSGRGRPTCRAGGGGGATQHLWLKMIPTSR